MISKFWYAFLHLGYEKEDIKNHAGHCLLVPLNIDVYKVCFKLMIKALQPSMFSSEKYVVYNDTNYKRKYVLFDRFKFDLCSLISRHIEQGTISAQLFEIVLRQVYKSITFFPEKDKLMIRRFNDVQVLVAAGCSIPPLLYF